MNDNTEMIEVEDPIKENVSITPETTPIDKFAQVVQNAQQGLDINGIMSTPELTNEEIDMINGGEINLALRKKIMDLMLKMRFYIRGLQKMIPQPDPEKGEELIVEVKDERIIRSWITGHARTGHERRLESRAKKDREREMAGFKEKMETVKVDLQAETKGENV